MRSGKLNFHSSAYKQDCASPFILASLFSDVKKSVFFFFPRYKLGQHDWAPEEDEEKRSILKSEPFDGAETGRG